MAALEKVEIEVTGELDEDALDELSDEMRMAIEEVVDRYRAKHPQLTFTIY